MSNTGIKDESLRLKCGKALYDQNLRLLVEKIKLNQRAIWRICMDDKGIILHMIKCRKIEKPKPNSFLFITSDDYKPPRFGSFNCLSGYQLNIANILKEDITKLLNANELAYCLAQGKKKAGTVEGIDQLAERFGELPTPALKHMEEEKEMQEKSKKEKESEKMFVLNNVVPEGVFESFVEREKKKKKKRQRQKKKKGQDDATSSETEKSKQTETSSKPSINFDAELFRRLNMAS